MRIQKTTKIILSPTLETIRLQDYHTHFITILSDHGVTISHIQFATLRYLVYNRGGHPPGMNSSSYVHEDTYFRDSLISILNKDILEISFPIPPTTSFYVGYQSMAPNRNYKNKRGTWKTGSIWEANKEYI